MARYLYPDRSDLSQWVIHFVHARNELCLPCDDDLPDDLIHVPYTVDIEKNSRYDSWDIRDEEYPMDPQASAFYVLLRILEEGIIRSSWAFRMSGPQGKLRPTIYGPRAACCFTEMPLYAFLQYVRNRHNEKAIDSYAISLLRNDLFLAGGRPVIYGLSGKHKEQTCSSLIPRLLDPTCGLSEHEQYRYVAFNLANGIDWTHEREWRWSDIHDSCFYPGLPVWTVDPNIKFSKVLVLVRSNSERETILQKLKEMYDSGCDPYCIEYSRETIQNTFVVSLDEILGNEIGDKPMIRLEDLPTHRLKKYKTPIPSADYIANVKIILTQAISAADKAAEDYRNNALRNSDGFIKDVYGFADLVVRDSQSEFVQALLCLNACESLSGVGYVINGLTDGCKEHVLGEKESAVRAAEAVFKEVLPRTSFYVRTTWD